MAEWSTTGSLPSTGFRGFGFASVNQYAYLVGGYARTTGSPLNNNVYRYDIISNTWTIITTTPNAARYFAAVTIDNTLYCFFGTSDYVGVSKYNTVTNIWSQGGTVESLWNASQNSFVVVNKKIFILPRDISTTTPGTINIRVYDTETDQWNMFSPVPYARYLYGLASSGTDIYILGGDEIPTSNWADVSSVSVLNTITGNWREVSPMIRGKHDFATALYGSEIYAIAGTIQNTSGQYSTDVSEVQIYNIASDSWRYGISSPFIGGGFFAAVINGVIISTNGLNYYTFDLRQATITNHSPTSGFVNEKTSNIFTWVLESNPAGTAQQSATFQWRSRGASTINTINIGATQSITIPANTLPNGEFEWRVSATNTSGVVAPYTDWFLLTTIDERPNKPTGLYPNTGSRDGTKIIQFSWLHNSPLSTPQLAFEVQISYDGGYSWKALSNKITTAVTQFTAAANTILPTDQTGRVGWRVRTYNSDNLESPWSDTAFFIVHPAPQTPNWISVETGRARPLCRWTSLGQVGFQLQVMSGDTVIFDSGEIPGTAIEYRIPTFLPNGIFTFRLRIKNIRSLLSAWSSRSVSINARRSLNINLQGAAIDNGAQLTFNVEVRAGG